LIGQSDYPLGTLQKLDQQLGEMTGIAALRFTMQRICDTARMVLRDGLEAVRNSRRSHASLDIGDPEDDDRVSALLEATRQRGEGVQVPRSWKTECAEPCHVSLC